jgi:hypothetical protein
MIPDEDPELYEIVTRRMIHGPCGELNLNCSCMFDGKCSKGNPKDYEPHTRKSMAIPDIEDVVMVGPSKLETLRLIIDGWSHIINIC